MGKVLNFDQFMSEKNKEVITVTVLGKEYEVPAEIPAIVPIMMARAERTKSANDHTKMIMRAADAMFGNDAVDEMCMNGLTSNDLVALISQLFDKIKTPDDEEDEEEDLSDEDSRTAVKGGKSAKK